jgi:hypothetical protein
VIELQVPTNDEIVISYAGLDPITYRPEKGVVEVAERHVDEFLAVVPGSGRIAPPAAEPAADEASAGGKTAKEK